MIVIFSGQQLLLYRCPYTVYHVSGHQPVLYCCPYSVYHVSGHQAVLYHCPYTVSCFRTSANTVPLSIHCVSCFRTSASTVLLSIHCVSCFRTVMFQTSASTVPLSIHCVLSFSGQHPVLYRCPYTVYCHFQDNIQYCTAVHTLCIVIFRTTSSTVPLSIHCVSCFRTSASTVTAVHTQCTQSPQYPRCSLSSGVWGSGMCLLWTMMAR